MYFGGGTPSLLPAEDLERVLGACRSHLALATPAPWIFLEANPEDVTPDACAAWRGLGVRTLSLGVQSFSDEALRFLGRRHGAAQARAAVETALSRGLRHRLGRPHLRPARPDRRRPGGATWRRPWRSDRATCRATSSRSTRARGSVCAAKRGQLSEMPEGEQAVLFDLTHRFLADAGYAAYEVSNFARGREHESRHNRKYWDHTPYLGLGPSAHSLAVADAGALPAARRWWNELRTPRWESRVAAGERPVEGEESLGPKALATEAVMLGLRTTAGIDLDGFTARYGLDLLAANDALVGPPRGRGPPRGARPAPRVAGGWLPTASGLAVADGMATAFEIPLPSRLDP